MKLTKRLLALVLTLLLVASAFACAAQLVPVPNAPDPVDLPVYEADDTPCPVSEDGEYWTKDDVALYIHLYGHLPKNYISKSKAQSLGWEGGSAITKGCCRRRKDAPIPNVTSTRAAKRAAAQSGSCSATTD